MVLIRGKKGPKFGRRIKDMQPGELGYSVPWAYSPNTSTLNEEFTIHPYKQGTVELPVRCLAPGSYEISFDEVSYEY